jgi:hypothetical protein
MAGKEVLMTYLGEVRNGTVVLKDNPPLEEGAIVRVELVEKAAEKPRRGSLEALLSFKAGWAGDPAELDRLLEEVQEDREAAMMLLDEDDRS